MNYNETQVKYELSRVYLTIERIQRELTDLQMDLFKIRKMVVDLQHYQDRR